MLEYKGYIGNVEFDDEADTFYGEVINLRDVITFKGRTVDEIRKAFKESVDDYLEFCSERNESPEKPFSGKFTVRLNPELHRDIYFQAKKSHKSLNSWIAEILESAIHIESDYLINKQNLKNHITK